MRGLNARVAYAQAVVLAVIDIEKGSEAINESLFDVEFEGYHDYRHGNFEVPVLIRDVPVLVSSWECGQAIAANLAAQWQETQSTELEGA